MSNCNNCFNGCTETISDQCIKYTGIDVPDLGIRTGDSLSFVEQALITSLTSTLGGEGITIDLSNIDICTLVQNYLPAQPPSEGFTLNDILAALIQVSCSTQSQLVSNYNSTNALINTQHTTFADANNAMASLITTISATMDADRSHTAALIQTEQDARVDAYSAMASLITTISAKLNTATEDISGLITSISNIEVDSNGALATQIDELSASFDTDKASLAALITAEANTRANADGALSSRIDTITASGVDLGFLDSKIDAAIVTERTATVTREQAIASSVTSLTSTVNGHTSSITTNQSAIANINGNLTASYGLNVDSNGHIASMNLLSNGTTSSVAFRADTFKIFNGTINVAPFTVVDGNVIMTGTTVVDSIVTPGTGPAIGVTGWNGLSLNKTNDNLLQFRHPNGAIGMKMGIVGGVLTLKWYNDSGVLIWEGGSDGVKAIENTAATYAGQITNVGRIRVNKDGIVSVEGDIANQLGGYVYTSRSGALPTSISTSIGWQFTGTSPAGMTPNNGYEYVSFTSIVPGSAGINSRIDIVLKNDPGTKYKINLYDESIGFGGFGLYATPTAVKKSSTNYQGTDPFVNSTISIFDGLTDYTDVERYIYFETQTTKF